MFKNKLPHNLHWQTIVLLRRFCYNSALQCQAGRQSYCTIEVRKNEKVTLLLASTLQLTVFFLHKCTSWPLTSLKFHFSNFLTLALIFFILSQGFNASASSNGFFLVPVMNEKFFNEQFHGSVLIPKKKQCSFSCNFLNGNFFGSRYLHISVKFKNLFKCKETGNICWNYSIY